VPLIAGQIEDRSVGVDVALEISDDLPPDVVLAADLALVEAGVIELW
jgi:hypothetical protein